MSIKVTSPVAHMFSSVSACSQPWVSSTHEYFCRPREMLSRLSSAWRSSPTRSLR
jgi:hypothetical protein